MGLDVGEGDVVDEDVHAGSVDELTHVSATVPDSAGAQWFLGDMR